MAETSHKALEAVNGANVEELLVKVLDGREVLGLSVAVAAGTSSPSSYFELESGQDVDSAV